VRRLAAAAQSRLDCVHIFFLWVTLERSL
jgi:hypothetical protein